MLSNPRLLTWTEGQGRLHGIVALLRAARAGFEVEWHPDGLAFAQDSIAAETLRRAGLATTEIPADRAGAKITLPRIVLLAGPSSGYPYAAYYAHCLWALGLSFTATGARGVAAGALLDADLLVIPGGFATWGLDRAEDAPGADVAVRRFLDRGGAVIGSCGGAFYLSSGRPGWQGSADVKPKFTHEYLLTGAAVLNVRITDERLAVGLTDEVEVAYYHGPVWPEAGHNAPALASFAGFACPSRLFIDNPLQADLFERDMTGRPAVLAPDGQLGRAVLFSPHPEMGDLLRKWIALDGYVRKYLAIRGPKVMEETLRYYSADDSQSFRLVLNAAARLDAFSRAKTERSSERPADTVAAISAIDTLAASLDAEFSSLAIDLDSEKGEPWCRLVAGEAERVRGDAHGIFARLRAVLDSLGSMADREVVAELVRLSGEAEVALRRPSGAPIVERMSFLELPVRLASAAARLLEADAAVQSLRTRARTA